LLVVAMHREHCLAIMMPGSAWRDRGIPRKCALKRRSPSLRESSHLSLLDIRLITSLSSCMQEEVTGGEQELRDKEQRTT
jgi:hypothetical protein